MQFEYEISADDYAAAQILYRRLKRNRIPEVGWLLLGGVLTWIGLREQGLGLSPIVLAGIGVYCMWAGVGRVFPASLRRNYLRHYRTLEHQGTKYRADANETGVEIAGGNTSWWVPWGDVSIKGEDPKVFMFYSKGTLFIFAKRFLQDVQHRELRTIAGLAELAS
jgi:hypothetical protein